MKILKSMYIPLSFFLLSCSTSTVYRSKAPLQTGLQTICGQAFCTETKIVENEGIIHVKTLKNDTVINPSLIAMEAHCHNSGARALHLRTQKLSTEVVPLTQRDDHWEFPLNSVEEGCRFELMVYTKKAQEKFTFQPQREYIR